MGAMSVKVVQNAQKQSILASFVFFLDSGTWSNMVKQLINDINVFNQRYFSFYCTYG